MSWTSGVPWAQPSQFATTAISHVKEWYSTHSIGQSILSVLAVIWIVHIVSQLVYTPPRMIVNFAGPARSY